MEKSRIKTCGKTHRNPYPHLEGMGFVRVRNWLPRPIPRCTLPVTPAGFRTRGIPYLQEAYFKPILQSPRRLHMDSM